jgi:hypothetical protein
MSARSEFSFWPFADDLEALSGISYQAQSGSIFVHEGVVQVA